MTSVWYSLAVSTESFLTVCDYARTLPGRRNCFFGSPSEWRDNTHHSVNNVQLGHQQVVWLAPVRPPLLTPTLLLYNYRYLLPDIVDGLFPRTEKDLFVSLLSFEWLSFGRLVRLSLSLSLSSHPINRPSWRKLMTKRCWWSATIWIPLPSECNCTVSSEDNDSRRLL